MALDAIADIGARNVLITTEDGCFALVREERAVRRLQRGRRAARARVEGRLRRRAPRRLPGGALAGEAGRRGAPPRRRRRDRPRRSSSARAASTRARSTRLAGGVKVAELPPRPRPAMAQAWRRTSSPSTRAGAPPARARRRTSRGRCGCSPKGWDRAVWLVDEELVAAFPRKEVVVPMIEREIALLPRLAPLLPRPIPDAACSSGEPSDGVPVAGAASRYLAGRGGCARAARRRELAASGLDLARSCASLHAGRPRRRAAGGVRTAAPTWPTRAERVRELRAPRRGRRLRSRPPAVEAAARGRGRAAADRRSTASSTATSPAQRPRPRRDASAA